MATTSLSKDKSLKPDGKQTPEDDLEGHPEFGEDYQHMTDEFFQKESPDYYALMQRIKNVDKAPAKKD